MTPISTLSTEREAQLLHRIAQGDRGAMGELLQAYQRPVYQICYRMLHNSETAAEIAQDAMLQAVKHIDTFKKNSRFSTWLIRIAMNLSVSELRRSSYRWTESLDRPASERGDSNTSRSQLISSDREPNPSQCVETVETLTMLEKAIAELDEPLRAVIVLRDIQEMDYAAMAEVLSVPVGTVKSRLFRARLALRQRMNQLMG